MAADRDRLDERLDDPSALPEGNPGGASAKGYTADPNPGRDDVPDPVPLADPPPGAKVRPPDPSRPTGRGEPGHGLILPEGG